MRRGFRKAVFQVFQVFCGGRQPKSWNTYIGVRCSNVFHVNRAAIPLRGRS